MPSKTEKQHRAMEAAAHGNSTLGIPQSVGQKFVAADSGKKGMATGGYAGKRLVDHGDHFKVHTKDGKVHTIAKNGLHHSTVKHLQKFAEGGVAKYAEKGLVEAGDDAPPAREGEGVMTQKALDDRDIEKERQRAAKVVADAEAREKGERGEGDPTVPQVNTNLSIPDQVAQESNFAETTNAEHGYGREPATIEEDTGEIGPNGEHITRTVPNPAYRGPTGGGFLNRTADTTHTLPSAGPNQLPPGTVTSENVQFMPYQAAQVSGLTSKERGAAGAAQTANTEFANTQHDISQRTQAELQKQADAETARQQAYDKEYGEVVKRRQQLQSDIENSKIDPNHYWHEKGTGGRIMASIGLLLSGLGSGLGGGPNMAMQVIQNNIKRDIDAQEKNLDTKKSLLSDTYRQTGDMRLSRMVAEHSAAVVSQAMLNKLAAESGDAKVKQAAAVANANIDMVIGQQERSITDRRLANKAAAYNMNAQTYNSLQLQRAKKGDELKTPREMQGDKISKMNASLVKLDEHLTNLGKGSQGPIAGRIAEKFPWGGADTKANAAEADRLRESIASAFGGGVASDTRIKQMMSSIPDPTDTPEQARIKIMRLKRDLQVMRDEYIAQQSGVQFKTGPHEPVSVPEAPGSDQ